MAWLWRRPARPKLLRLSLKGRKLFPSRGAGAWRPAPCASSPRRTADRDPGGRSQPPPPTSLSRFLSLKQKICLSLQQRDQPGALEMESSVQSTGAGVGVSGPPRAGGGDPAVGHLGSRSPACRGPLRSSPPPHHALPRIPSARIVPLPRGPHPSPPFLPSLSAFSSSLLSPSSTDTDSVSRGP